MLLPRLALLMLLPFVFAAEPTAKPVVPAVPKGFHTVALNGHNFTLPDGFTIELVASTPRVNRPISAAFDDKGRLYVTDSSGSNDKPSEQVKTKPHRIVRLAVRDRAAARAAVHRILEWDFDRVIVTHGAVLERGGRERFAAAFAYLG